MAQRTTQFPVLTLALGATVEAAPAYEDQARAFVLGLGEAELDPNVIALAVMIAYGVSSSEIPSRTTYQVWDENPAWEQVESGADEEASRTAMNSLCRIADGFSFATHDFIALETIADRTVQLAIYYAAAQIVENGDYHFEAAEQVVEYMGTLLDLPTEI